MKKKPPVLFSGTIKTWPGIISKYKWKFTVCVLNSFLSGKNKENPKEGIFSSFIKNETVAAFMNTMSGHIAERVLENIDGLIDSAFHQGNKK